MNSDLVKNWLIFNTDVCFLTETHLKPGQKFDVPPFTTINHSYGEYSKRPRGGVSCLIKSDVLEYILHVDKSRSDHIVLTLRGDHEVFSSYIPPVDSIYFRDEMFTSVSSQFLQLDQDIVIFGGGDINCRVANLIKKPTGNSFYRKNPDTDINSHGRFLAEICNSFKCFPLNNLCYEEKNFDGKFTFYKANKNSQNDIILGNQYALDNIEKFTIHEISFNPLDHFPVTVTCNFQLQAESFMANAASDLLTGPSESGAKKAHKIKLHDVNWENYQQIADQELEKHFLRSKSLSKSTQFR